MSFYDAKYPNLELIEYKFRQLLNRDEEWKKKVRDAREKNRHIYPDYEAIVFPQIWGSTNTAFDVCKDGSPAIGGCAMTKAYTVVVKETLTETYGIFVDGEACYMVDNPSDEFYKDLSERNMKSLSEAKDVY